MNEGVDHKIKPEIGPGLETLDKLIAAGQTDSFDFAYIDADKENYPNYVDRLVSLLKPNGFIMVDNILWRGKVADPVAREQETSTAALHQTVQNALKDSRVEICTVMLADGFSVIRKK